MIESKGMVVCLYSSQNFVSGDEIARGIKIYGLFWEHGKINFHRDQYFTDKNDLETYLRAQVKGVSWKELVLLDSREWNQILSSRANPEKLERALRNAGNTISREGNTQDRGILDRLFADY